MADQNSVPYRLRQNKSVDRELFISLLNRLSAHLKIENYSYIGMGGPFMEDFRLIHSRIGITDMVSIEADDNIYERQKYNRPIPSIKCKNETFENFLEKTKIKKPTIIWLDFSDPRELYNQISVFRTQVSSLPPNSILRITINANPSTLGGNGKSEIDLKKHRLEQLRNRLKDYFPEETTLDDLKTPNYGKILLKAILIAIGKDSLTLTKKYALDAFSTYYADGHEMITYTVMIIQDIDLEKYEPILKAWEFYCPANEPIIIDIPMLSSLERVMLEKPNEFNKLKYTFPYTKFKQDPLVSFKRFKRILPHFAKVDF